jgi:hypothetical protein
LTLDPRSASAKQAAAKKKAKQDSVVSKYKDEAESRTQREARALFEKQKAAEAAALLLSKPV